MGCSANFTGDDIVDAWGSADTTLLAGCAPCQPFSTYSQSWSSPEDKRWDLLSQFARLVRESVRSSDNGKCAEAKKIDVFERFQEGLERDGYHVTHKVINCCEYGVPQRRQRLVLLASRFGVVDLSSPRLN